MIERIKADSGDVVFKVKGRLMASAKNPKKEALRWVEGYRRQIQSCDQLIVLGLGCGYHLAELCRQYPNKKVLVFSHDEGLKDKVYELQGLNLGQANILSLSKDEILSSFVVKRVLSRVYTILVHPPSYRLNSQYFQPIKELLIGREFQAFQFHIEGNPKFEGLFHFDNKMGFDLENGLSINELEQSLNNSQISNWPDYCLIKALKEMTR